MNDLAIVVPADLNDEVLSIMECPVCFGVLRPPIRLCANGHGVCSDCFPKLNKICPQCRGDLLRPRCRLLETLYDSLTVPCKNQFEGCSFVCDGRKMGAHHRQCDFRTVKCPRRCTGCEWKGPLTCLTKHVIENHSFLRKCPKVNEGCYWEGPRTMLTKHYIENHS